jgi:hypothetical protein
MINAENKHGINICDHSGAGQADSPPLASITAALDKIDLMGKLSRTEIARSAGISSAAATGVCAYLLSQGYVKECGAGYSHGGRRPTFLEIAADLGNVLVLEADGQGARASLLDYGARLIQCRHFKRADMDAEIGRLLENARESDVVLAADINAPGGEAAAAALNLRNVPFEAVHPVHACALAESRQFYNGAHRRLVYVSIGTVVEASVAEYGRIRAKSLAVPLRLGNCEGLDGTRLDEYISAAALPAPGSSGPAGGGEAALRWAEDLLRALRNLCVVLEPDVIVLNGCSALLASPLYDPARERFEAALSGMPCEVAFSHFGSRKTLIGTVKLAFMRRFHL